MHYLPNFVRLAESTYTLKKLAAASLGVVSAGTAVALLGSLKQEPSEPPKTSSEVPTPATVHDKIPRCI